MRHLSSGTGWGLFDCVQKAVEYMGADDWETELIGFGCDGTNANMADGGLKGLSQGSCAVGNCLLVLRASPGIIFERCSKKHVFLHRLMSCSCKSISCTKNLLRNAENWRQ